MNKIFLSLIVLLAVLISCSYSDEEKQQAENLYETVLISVSNIVEADSTYGICLQYLMREMQKPLLKRDKDARKQVEDSAKVLIIRYDSLLNTISKSCARIDSAEIFDDELDIISPAKNLCQAYEKVSNEEYKVICDRVTNFKFPVNDAEYTEILSLTYTADSLLNERVSVLNEIMKEFAGKYDLIPEKE